MALATGQAEEGEAGQVHAPGVRGWVAENLSQEGEEGRGWPAGQPRLRALLGAPLSHGGFPCKRKFKGKIAKTIKRVLESIKP